MLIIQWKGQAMRCIRGVRKNPLAAQLTRRGGPLNKGWGLALLALLFSAALAGLTSLAPPLSGRELIVLYASVGRFTPPFAWRVFESWAGFSLTLALVVAIPVVAAVSTALVVSRHAGAPNLLELRLTLLPERRIVQGYVWAALGRMPVVLALTVGLCVSLLFWVPLTLPQFLYDHLAQGLFVLLRLVGVTDILVRVWLAVTLGVALALWVRRSPYLAALGAIGLSLAITLAWMVGQSMLLARIQPPLTDLFVPLIRYNVQGALLAVDILNNLLWAGLAAGLAVVSARLAAYGVRLEQAG
jgi:hypothetical protein